MKIHNKLNYILWFGIIITIGLLVEPGCKYLPLITQINQHTAYPNMNGLITVISHGWKRSVTIPQNWGYRLELSPDGNSIAYLNYARTMEQSASDESFFHLGVYNTKTAEIIDVLIHEETNFAWSPDSSTLLFTISEKKNEYQLTRLNLIDNTLTRLPITFDHRPSIAWAPGPHPLVDREEGDISKVYLLDESTNQMEYITTGDSPAWRKVEENYLVTYLKYDWAQDGIFLYQYDQNQKSETELLNIFPYINYQWSSNGRYAAVIEGGAESQKPQLVFHDLSNNTVIHLKYLLPDVLSMFDW